MYNVVGVDEPAGYVTTINNHGKMPDTREKIVDFKRRWVGWAIAVFPDQDQPVIIFIPPLDEFSKYIERLRGMQ